MQKEEDCTNNAIDAAVLSLLDLEGDQESPQFERFSLNL